MSPYERGVMRGAMRAVMGMRDECLHMRVINFSALRCPRNNNILFILKCYFIIILSKIMDNLWKCMVYLL